MSLILYHGTSSKYLPSILREGIKPRKLTRQSNWKTTIESRNDMVYLTNAYALYFAICSLRQKKRIRQ